MPRLRTGSTKLSVNCRIFQTLRAMREPAQSARRRPAVQQSSNPQGRFQVGVLNQHIVSVRLSSGPQRPFPRGCSSRISLPPEVLDNLAQFRVPSVELLSTNDFPWSPHRLAKQGFDSAPMYSLVICRTSRKAPVAPAPPLFARKPSCRWQNPRCAVGTLG